MLSSGISTISVWSGGVIWVSMSDILPAPGDGAMGCYRATTRAITSPAWPLHAAEHLQQPTCSVGWQPLGAQAVMWGHLSHPEQWTVCAWCQYFWYRSCGCSHGCSDCVGIPAEHLWKCCRGCRSDRRRPPACAGMGQALRAHPGPGPAHDLL